MRTTNPTCTFIILSVILQWYMIILIYDTAELSTLHRWALCEVMISVICACLPDLRILLLRTYYMIREPAKTSSSGSTAKTLSHSHITVTNTFKTDYDIKSRDDEMENYVQLVHMAPPQRELVGNRAV